MSVTRRAFTARLAASLAAVGVPPTLRFAVEPPSGLGISHTADAIHQTRVFTASPARVYAALTDPKQFDGVVKLSDAMKSMALQSTPSVISTDAGGTFALFGGYVTGRQIELVPRSRIVQVWRAGSWKPGEYSLVRFELTEQGSTTMLTLDHTGFPARETQHLAEGWQANYLEPLAKYLG